MAFEHKPGTFSLFKNDRKTADNHPDYRGEGKDLQGHSIEVAAWLKQGTKGKFMSCSFKPARVREDHDQPAPEPRKQQNEDMDNDSIPF